VDAQSFVARRKAREGGNKRAVEGEPKRHLDVLLKLEFASTSQKRIRFEGQGNRRIGSVDDIIRIDSSEHRQLSRPSTVVPLRNRLAERMETHVIANLLINP